MSLDPISGTPETSENQPPLGLRRFLGRALFLLILTAQILVPTVQLGATRPARFGWQMFAGAGPQVAYTVELDDGTVDSVAVGEYVVGQRPEMELPSSLPPHICARIRAAKVVRVYVHPDRATEPTSEYPCP